jgi:hypothetical protein
VPPRFVGGIGQVNHPQGEESWPARRSLARGEADIEAGVGYDLESVMAEAEALLDES